ncbi:helix-turn-helix domain-containing protein [Haladaptatus sp.]|uniref:helix-turn-helix domain-containing protein n=1 Tax=Haladaptatus sp. TaxID=1973141 RepID=UPI003C4E9163
MTLQRGSTYCEVRDISYTLDRVATDLAEEREEFGLTPEQRETLMLALERDYFDVPRGVTLGELADELGVTQQSVSERVRRGTGSVLEAVLLEANGRDTGST